MQSLLLREISKMPSICRDNVAAATANALTGLKNNTVGPDGAYLTLFASTPTTGGNVDFTAEGGNLLISDAAAVNTEQNADEVAVPLDLIALNEPVAAGELFLAINAQIVNFKLFISDQPLVF